MKILSEQSIKYKPEFFAKCWQLREELEIRYECQKILVKVDKGVTLDWYFEMLCILFIAFL